MQETVKMNVKLSIKDIRHFIFGEYYNRIKVTFIICAGITAIVFILFTIASLSILDWFLFTALLVNPVLLLLAMTMLKPVVRYIVMSSFYKKQKNFSIAHWYEFSQFAINAASETDRQTYHWNYIFKIEEFRAGFQIYTAPDQLLIIPRRCFTSQAQLDLFYTLITSNLSSSKLDLKKHRSAKFTPDKSAGTAPPDVKPQTPVPDETPLAEISFKLSNSEFIAYYYKRIYTRPIGLFVVIIGLVLLIYGLTSNDTISLIVWAVTGTIILLVTPIKLYFKTIKPLFSDPNIMKTVTYRFYTDQMISDGYADAKLHMRWNEIFKIRESKSSYIIYANKQTAHLIPKRVFADKQEQLEVFLSLLQKAQK